MGESILRWTWWASLVLFGTKSRGMFYLGQTINKRQQSKTIRVEGNTKIDVWFWHQTDTWVLKTLCSDFPALASLGKTYTPRALTFTLQASPASTKKALSEGEMIPGKIDPHGRLQSASREMAYCKRRVLKATTSAPPRSAAGGSAMVLKQYWLQWPFTACKKHGATRWKWSVIPFVVFWGFLKKSHPGQKSFGLFRYCRQT